MPTRILILSLVPLAGCFTEPEPSTPSDEGSSGSSSSGAGEDGSTVPTAASTSSSSTSTGGSFDASSGEATAGSSSGDPDESDLLLWQEWNGDYVDTVSGEEGVPTGDASVNTSALELHGNGTVDISYFGADYTSTLDDMTVSIRYFANTGDGLRVLLAFGDNGESLSTNAHELRILNNVFELLTETGEGEDHFVELGPTPSFAVGSWHTVTFVFDGGFVRTCSDGERLSELKYVPAQTTASKLFVGGTWISGEGFDGFIDDLRIWDRSLVSESVGCS